MEMVLLKLSLAAFCMGALETEAPIGNTIESQFKECPNNRGLERPKKHGVTMKRLFLFTILSSLGVCQSVFANEDIYRCSSFNEASQYSLKIEVSPSAAKILQAAPNARFGPIDFNVQEDAFTTVGADPTFECRESFANGYKVHILVFEDRIQVLQSHPAIRFRPLQFTVIN